MKYSKKQRRPMRNHEWASMEINDFQWKFNKTSTAFNEKAIKQGIEIYANQ